MGYRLVRALMRLLLAIFYRSIDIVGGERVPARGPLIVAANHHNSLVDAMLLMAVIPRRLSILANAPLFRHPLIGPFLRLIGALPVHRLKEAGSDRARNAALFAATTRTLRAGGAILIFPEGRTQPEPVLLELRTGAARMLLDAEGGYAMPRAVTLLPVGLVFHDPGTFRSGRALALVGAPVVTADCVALARDAYGEAARRLTARLADALRQLIVETGDRATLHLLELVMDLAEGEAAPANEAERVARLQRGLRVYGFLQRHHGERVAALRTRIEAFAADLQSLGLELGQLSRTYPAKVVLGFAAREGLAILLGLPLALIGIILHVVPYRLTAVVVRLLRRTDEEEATDKIAAGLLLFPLAWTVEGYIAWQLGDGRMLATLLVALAPAGFFALAWRERLHRTGGEALAFARYLADPDKPRRLADQRRELAGDLAELLRLAPDV
jgi:glycerol-3-phosphate O-acyltransferase/dihydroxyacetone phosphate acyltransferase